jgi:flavin-binding protein dodecin
MLPWPWRKPGTDGFPQIGMREEKPAMTNAVAKVIELTASSSKSIEDAVENGIRRADTTLDNVEGAWVQDIKCVVKNGKIAEWRVNMKVTFLLKE